MIEAKNLSFHYQGSRHQVFSGFNLTLGEGKVHGLLGRNGTGKSTLLYLIAGLLAPCEGSVTFDGKESCRRSPSMLSQLFLVPEEYAMPQMSFRQFAAQMRAFYPTFNDDLLARCLRDFEMPAEPNLRELSMGQKKKVYMSFAIAAGTRLLMMDEPTNGLDIPSRSLFRKVVANYMDDSRTLIISTHQVHDVETLLDHVSIIDGSRVLLDDDMGALADKYDFKLIQPQDDTEDVLYTEPSLQGNMAILSHQQDEQTQVNLELLFNAVSKGAIKPESATSKSNAL